MPSTKIRASCDSCHFAKVKCNKGERGCLRCTSLEVKCTYSPAVPRVYHRRSRKASLASDQARGAPHPGHLAATPPDTLPEEEISIASEDFPLTGHGSGGSAGASTPVSLSMSPQHFVPFDGSARLYWPDANLVSNMTRLNAEQSSEGQDWADVRSMPSPSSCLHTVDSLTLGRSGLPSISESSPPSDTAYLSLSARTDSCSSIILSSTASRNSSSSNTETPSSQAQNKSTSCQCFPRLLAAMKHMEEHTSVADAALDRVLCTNRVAAKDCVASLQCTSSPSGTHTTMNMTCQLLACGLLDRMIQAYQNAVRRFCDLNTQTDCSSFSPYREESDLYNIRPSVGIADAMTPDHALKLRLGDFAVETQDQIMYTKRIVVTEVEKVRRTAMHAQGETHQDRLGMTSMLLKYLIQRCDEAIERISE